jgi:hypothetical protein
MRSSDRDLLCGTLVAVAGGGLILNRDLLPDHVPRFPVLQLELPGGGNPYAWNEIWRFALTFDPDGYEAGTGKQLDAPALAQSMLAALPTEDRLPGHLAELRTVLWWLYWEGGQGMSLPLGNVMVEALLDAIYGRVAGGQKRPTGETGPFEPALGPHAGSVPGTSGQHRFWFLPRRAAEREDLYDAVAGLLLRAVDDRAYISALYLYPPSYSVDTGELVSHTFMLLLEPRSRGSSDLIGREYDRLTRLVIAALADRSKDHYPGPDAPISG